MNPRLLLNPLFAFLLVAKCRPALASVVVTIVGDEVDAQISVSAPGGPTYSADFKLNFSDPVNLSEACLGLSATYLDAAARAAIEARMPQSGLQIDPDFPVLISVSPPSACGLVFRNEVRVELRTENPSTPRTRLTACTRHRPWRTFATSPIPCAQACGPLFAGVDLQTLWGPWQTVGRSAGHQGL